MNNAAATSAATAATTGRYEAFLREVRRAQLAQWLSLTEQRILDLSAGCPALLDVMTSAGHEVVHVTDDPDPDHLRPGDGLHLVVAERGRMDWLRPGSIDAVVAEGSALSAALATEVTVDDLSRALRPGGRLLITVNSLLSGLSELAGQGRWAELADVPAADVVLIPGANESVTRCFAVDELHEMLTGAGFDVEWIQPRTVLTEETVSLALEQPEEMRHLVQSELRLAAERRGESLGAELVASARRR